MITLKPATAADITTLVNFDEMASVASTHGGFSPAQRAHMRDFYTSAIGSEHYEALLIYEEGDLVDRELYGSLLLQHERPAETYAQEVGAPFVLPDSDAKPIPADELRGILSGAAGAKRSHIKSISLAPQARGRGVGKTVLELVIAKAKERGATALSFTTAVDNHSMQKLAKRATWLRVQTSKPAPALPEKLIAVIKI
jgi:ribosomal protein S18 acetylase RimI-like enzyme